MHIHRYTHIYVKEYTYIWDFSGSSVIKKNLPVKQEIWVRRLGGEDPLGKEMATHSNILAWEIQ